MKALGRAWFVHRDIPLECCTAFADTSAYLAALALQRGSCEGKTRVLSLNRKLRRGLYRLNYWAMPTVSLPGYHSQHGQDRFVADLLFHSKRGGVFVDVGAYEGITFSNTLHFEREFGWTGIAVEPHPASFAELAASRNCLVSNCCMSPFRGNLVRHV